MGHHCFGSGGDDALDDTVGYRGATACKIAGITYVSYKSGDAAVQALRTGEVDVVITAPLFPGDDALYGDGLGVITGYVSSVAGVEVTHGAAPPIERTVSGFCVTCCGGLPPSAALSAQGFFLNGGRASPSAPSARL